MITSVIMSGSSLIGAPANTSLVIIAILTLLFLLIQKEIAIVLPSDSARRLSRALNIVLLPLLIVFIVVASLMLYDIFH